MCRGRARWEDELMKKLFPMKNYFWNSSPSPRPSPAGRGGIIARWFETPNDKTTSTIRCFYAPTASAKDLINSRTSAMASPSPGGEGRGEGERHTKCVGIRAVFTRNQSHPRLFKPIQDPPGGAYRNDAFYPRNPFY